MKNLFSVFLISLIIISMSCSQATKTETSGRKIRQVADTVGFAHLNWQMDSVSSRISSEFGAQLIAAGQEPETSWRVAICPHDDYTYASWLYPAVLKNITTKTLVIFGVAHKARNFGLENQIVFDSYDAWQGPFGEVPVSALRNQIIQQLPGFVPGARQHANH